MHEGRNGWAGNCVCVMTMLDTGGVKVSGQRRRQAPFVAARQRQAARLSFHFLSENLSQELLANNFHPLHRKPESGPSAPVFPACGLTGAPVALHTHALTMAKAKWRASKQTNTHSYHLGRFSSSLSLSLSCFVPFAFGFQQLGTARLL